MKKYIITAFAFITLLTGSVTFTACEDIDDIKELNLDRLLSPTNLTARVRDKVNIELTWDEMDRAQSYVIEVFKEDPDFTGTAISTLESEKATYTVTGLEGETSYSIRVKSVAEGITDSKWVSATRSTDAEQILLEVAEEDLTASEVTLRWPAGQVATEIIITPNDVAAHRVTSDEIAAGAATIKNLKSETTYTATLKNGDKTRGTMVFTTLINLDGALPAYPGDNLATIIATAEANATIVLLPKDDNNSFIYTDESGTAKTLEIELTKDVTIKGLYAENRPTTNIKFVLSGCNNFKIENLNLTASDGGTIITVLDSKGGNITVTNCDVTGFGSLLVENDNTQTGTINTFTVDNCIFHDMASGKRFVDYQKKKSFIAEFTLKNSTFYNCCSGSDFIRFDRHSTKGNIINISNCTLYGIEATSKGLFYVRSNSVGNKDFTANITKCIFANMSNKVFFSQDTKTDNLTFNSNYYFEAPSLLSIPEGGAGKVVDATGVTLDPGFTDAANGNFKVSNQPIIDNEIGDPRWRK